MATGALGCGALLGGVKPLTLDELQAKAKAFHETIEAPPFERTPEAIRRSVSETLSAADKALDRIGARKPSEMTFENTVRAIDDTLYKAGLSANRFAIIKDTHPDPAMRQAATEAIKRFEQWAVGVEYREDVYRAVKAVAARRPKLEGEDAKFLEETLRDYRRAGFELPKKDREEVERLRKELADLGTDFENNILKTRRPLEFTRKELEGVPESFLESKGIRSGPNTYTILANVTYHYLAVMENARLEATRRRLCEARFRLAMEDNLPILQRMLSLRRRIASKLGYATWADYVIEPRMAGTADRAREFCLKVRDGLEKRFRDELELMRRMKVRDTGEAAARIRIWDWRYYANRIKKENYQVDAEALRAYFPYQQALRGLFETAGKVFGLRVVPVKPPYKWVEDLQLVAVLDAETDEPLGLLYLDMFPREGKYNHFAQYGIIEGKLRPDGLYQRPVAALICNFPAPQPNRPSLLQHDEVETLFHEFGHALHTILTRAKHARFSGTSVPRDFVEVPSQLLEEWAWNRKALDSFAADYRDPSKKLPPDILQKLKAARLATIGSFYRRQMGFALTDLALHMNWKEEEDPARLANYVFGDAFLPPPERSAFVAFFGHLVGYDASYYGYGWADAIVADIASVFEKSPKGFFDADLGRRLRREIYEQGDSRPVEVSIRKFLGRDWNLDAFFRKNGIEPPR